MASPLCTDSCKCPILFLSSLLSHFRFQDSRTPGFRREGRTDFQGSDVRRLCNPHSVEVLETKFWLLATVPLVLLFLSVVGVTIVVKSAVDGQ